MTITCTLTERESSSRRPSRTDTHETCGVYVVDGGVLVKPRDMEVGKGTKEGERHRCEISLAYVLIWHTHPMSELYYPSLEDLMVLHQYRQLSNGESHIDDTVRVSVIYTMFGFWVLQQTHEKPTITNPVNPVLQELYYRMSAIFYSLLNPDLEKITSVVNYDNAQYDGPCELTPMAKLFMYHYFIPFLFDVFGIRAQFSFYGTPLDITVTIADNTYLTGMRRRVVQHAHPHTLTKIEPRQIMFTFDLYSGLTYDLYAGLPCSLKKEGTRTRRKRRSKKTRGRKRRGKK